MKKQIFVFLGVLVGILGFSFLVQADAIPPNSHPLERCVKVVNLDDFSEIALVGYYTGPMVKGHEAYEVKNNQCLEKGYKFNILSIYATSKEDLSSMGLKNIDLSKMDLLLDSVEPYGGYVNESDPLVKETIEYSVTKSPEGKISLEKTRQLSQFNNGLPEKVETFGNTTQTERREASFPQPEKKSFWQKIGCFFKGLFGKSC
jgi:hypothetical protein